MKNVFSHLLVVLLSLSITGLTASNIIHFQNTTIQQTLPLEILTSETNKLNKSDSLFNLVIITNENFVKIIPPKILDFALPDSFARIEFVKDFNADKKQDFWLYLGACGTGGCMYALFLNQYDDYYHLAFFDYLTYPSFEKDENGCLSILSHEEVEPYNPSNFSITKYKFDKRTNQFELDIEK